MSLNKSLYFSMIRLGTSNISKVAKVFKEITGVSRIKRFIFRFIAVPAKWIKTGRKEVLNIYSTKRYDLLWDG